MIETEIMRLKDLDRCELQRLWLEYFKTEPTSQNTKFYVARLAYRFQELTYGGISKELKKKLLKKGMPKREFNLTGLPPVGTRIVRTYQGKEYSVKVLKDGFDLEGKRYQSLSGMALKITGQKISGNYFFGIPKNRRPNNG